MEKHAKDFLTRYQEYLDKKLFEYKESLRLQKNDFLAKKISQAEEDLKLQQDKYTENYRKSMDELAEKRRLKNPDSFLIDRKEEFIKKLFTSSMEFSEKIFASFISDCRSNIK